MFDFDRCASIYVSPEKGSDKNTGLSPLDAFATLKRAVGAVGELRASGLLRPITVILAGDVFLKEPLVIDVPGITIDGRGHRVVGGFALTEWSPAGLNGVSCVCAKLPENCLGFSDLWVDGVRAKAPRFPEEGFLYADKRTPSSSGKQLYDGTDRFFADPADLAGVSGVDGASVGFFHYWIDEHSPVKSYDKETGELVMELSSRFCISSAEKDPARVRYWLDGVLSSFGKENEWYLDKENGTVYYKGEVKEALAPTLDYLIEVRSRDVRIRSVRLTCTRGDYASDGGFASDPQSVCGAQGAVIFENAKNCSMEDCLISGVGLHGIEIKNGCSAVRVENCRITDCGAGGVKIVGGTASEPPELAVTDCAVRGCEISFVSRRYTAGCGILACDTARLEISDCHIHHTAYSGISVGWVWGYGESSTFGCLIRRNHIHDIGTGALSDLGGIYLLGTQRGTFVEQNRVHSVKCADYGGWGVYTDEGSGFITIENNVVFDVQTACFHQHYGQNNVVRNNIFYSHGSALQITRSEMHRSVLFENNVLVCGSVPLFEHGGNYCCYASRLNLIKGASEDVMIAEGLPFSEWQSSGTDVGSRIADPGFADPENGDFTLRGSSPAFSLGFAPIKGFPATE